LACSARWPRSRGGTLSSPAPPRPRGVGRCVPKRFSGGASFPLGQNEHGLLNFDADRILIGCRDTDRGERLARRPHVGALRSALRAHQVCMDISDTHPSRRQWRRKAVLRRWGRACYYCGCDPDSCVTLDHVVPRYRGGSERVEDLVPCCEACNSDKGSLSLAEYRALVARRQPAWVAMTALSRAIAADRSLGRPETFRVLWALARVAGEFTFPGERVCADSGPPIEVGACEVLPGVDAGIAVPLAHGLETEVAANVVRWHR